MRIGDQQMSDQLKYQINTAYSLLVQTQSQLASGHQINSPADNPVGTGVVLDLQGKLAQNKQFTTTATDTQQWLQTTDTSISGVSNALIQARTLGVQAANGTLTLDEQRSIATGLTQLVQQAVDAANGSYAGRYVLSGTQTATPAFAYDPATGNVSYQGDSGVMKREISTGQLMGFNTPGNQALSPAFSAMTQLLKDVQSGSSSAISADLTTLDTAQSSVMVAQANVGASLNRIQAIQSTLETTNASLTAQSSHLTDVDFASASVDFASRQATYQAILAAAGKATQTTLIDFLK